MTCFSNGKERHICIRRTSVIISSLIGYHIFISSFSMRKKPPMVIWHRLLSCHRICNNEFAINIWNLMQNFPPIFFQLMLSSMATRQVLLSANMPFARFFLLRSKLPFNPMFLLYKAVLYLHLLFSQFLKFLNKNRRHLKKKC